MLEPRKILVVGSNGLIGRALSEHLAATNRPIVKTTRKGDPGTLALDLCADVASWALPANIDVAFLCAAATSLGLCRRQPAQTFAVNVTATVRLAELLVERGARVVFLSSNLVFDGSTSFAKADAAPSPRTEYGRQKVEAETRLLRWGDSVRIVRCTKVLAPGAGLLAQWSGVLKRGQSIAPFSDLVMSPISLAFVTDALERIGHAPEGGIMHISATRDITYEQAARRLATRLGASQSLVAPASAAGKVEHLPAHTTLDASRIERLFGLSAPDPWAAVDATVES